jgi:hypothetical protein
MENLALKGAWRFEKPVTAPGNPKKKRIVSHFSGNTVFFKRKLAQVQTAENR